MEQNESSLTPVKPYPGHSAATVPPNGNCCQLSSSPQLLFRNYLLLEEDFIIRTDHASLEWLVNFKEAEGLIGRWHQQLAVFHFTIQYRKGSNHDNADALSRAPPRRCTRLECPQCRPQHEFHTDIVLACLTKVDLHTELFTTDGTPQPNTPTYHIMAANQEVPP